ncbi:type IV pilus modification protein PilV [Neisseria meningitidis]|uniref:type IV pilus modification protein PilV n=1 Tax=Neisseria meningitidis TaxID=487 RepID=UPI000200D7A4|nr:type IV pilus modification protein PilV [Neisseria meningitidis]EQD06985.1 type IV pilus modification protein PilV [Neisseria meningitidis NM151]ADY97777.1 type IV pilus modification protein PilV [Neisseria meningitidis M01-240149]ADZ03376.1 type IV pilus modification protein PilV [Neisseria meningitidis NZ-05/33]EQD08425.1 type IV pilus modification protein PilV [Neisseria meningitidis NM151]MBG8627551.1 type IV pilus modification protein PilV [Neisseria meningitidis]
MKNNDCFRLKNPQSGMALIEVLVAMLVLTIGILALLSVQLRTVASVREAETQTIVSQITQNLMEGMLMNPTIDSDSNKKNYNLYMGNHHTLSAVDGDFAVDAVKSKKDLAKAQLDRFGYELKNALQDAAAIYYAVCKDSSGAAPTLSAGSTFSSNCDNKANGDTLIKVLWVNDSAGDSDIARTNLETNGNNIVYTYQARVGGRE